MIKRILVFTLCVLLLFGAGLMLHGYIVGDTLSFQLWHVYLYHAIATILVYVGMEGISSTLPNQSGYAYLVLMLFKLGLFILIFKNTVFEKDQLSQTDKFGLVIPMFLFLTAEAIAVAKLLNSK